MGEGQKEKGMRRHGKILVIGVFLLVKTPLLLFSQNVFLELNLNNQSLRNAALPAVYRTNLDIFRAIERAGNDNRIKGIVLNLSAFSGRHETMWELRQALEEFRAKGKKIVAFISYANLNLYYLATVADRIVMDDQGTMLLLGYAWGRGYAQRGLEMLGVGARELRYFEYKSAAETFTRDSISDADRRQYGEWLDDIMAVTREAITAARSWTDEEFYSIINNDFLLSARGALARGIVDAAGRRQAVIDAVKEISGGKDPAFVIFGDPESSITGSKRPYVLGRVSGGRRGRRPPVIAVINANGVTDMERGMAARTLARTIEETSQRRRTKAIVLRINSPGGSAEAADYIAEAVRRARERMPVVVSMGGVAASGGYWASMNANHITASPITITGSIGVIATWFYDRGLADRLGLTMEVMQRGNHADLMTGIILPRRDLNEAEQARFREYIVAHYDIFTAKVAASRGMEIEQVEAVAQGRIFSGLGALNAGLIDSIGGLNHAVRVARELAGIPENQGVVFEQLPRPSFFDRMMMRLVRMRISNRGAAMTAAFPAAGNMAGVEAALLMNELFIPAHMLEELRFRITHNGRAIPILPMDSWSATGAGGGR